MASSTVRTFTDPDAYRAAIRAERVEGIVTSRGNFHAEMTRIDLDRVLMQHAEENLPRVLVISTRPQRAAIIFATDQGQPAIHVSGMALTSGEIIAWDSRLEAHHRSAAACRWGSMSLTQEDLAGFVGATRVSVNRVLADLEKRGAIKIGRRNLTLKDRGILHGDIRY